MKIAELRTKSAEELKDLVLSLKKEQFNLRFQTATGASAAQSRFKIVRKTIARAKTIMNGADQKPTAETKTKASAAKKAPAKKTKAKKE